MNLKRTGKLNLLVVAEIKSSLLIMLFKSPNPNFLFLLVLTISEGGRLKF